MYESRESGDFDRLHPYETRNRSDLLPDRPRLTVAKNSLRVTEPTTYNSIPPEIQNLTTRSSFKMHYKRYLL